MGMRVMAEVFYCQEIDWIRDYRIWVVRQRGQGVLQGETLDYSKREEVGRNKIKVMKVKINWYQSHNTDDIKVNCIIIELIP